MSHFFTRLADLKDTLSPLPQPLSESAQRSAVQRGLSALFIVLGALSLLFITVAGFRYVISHGDPRVIEQSKNTILYAIIGLIISISAFTLINFVIGNL